MERFFKILYYYCLGFLVAFIAYLSIMLSISPKKDALKRGFIPCTEKFVQNMVLCEKGQMVCPLGYLWQDTKCNISVVLDGLGAWVKGKQNTPWESYLFEPVIEAEQNNETLYDGKVAVDMENLKAQREFIETRQKELEEAKNRQLGLDNNILFGISENNEDTDKEYYIQGKENQNIVNDGDISEEFFADKIEENSEKDGLIKKSTDNNDLKKINDVINKNNENVSKLKEASDKEEK